MGDDLNKCGFILLVGSSIKININPNLVRVLLGWDDLGLVYYCIG